MSLPAPRRLALRKGLDLPLSGAPEQVIHAGPPVRSVALLAEDYRGLRPKLCVREGDQVPLGGTLFRDSHQPEVEFTAPGAGVVSAIERGDRRELRAVVVRLEGEDARAFPTFTRDQLPQLDAGQVRDVLLTSGLWTALRCRPFGRMPSPRSRPDALFVQAMDTQPLAARAEVVVADRRQAFEDGLRVLGALVASPIFLCKAPGADLPIGDPDRVTVAEFSGPHPAGNVGTHIHHLCPVSTRRSAWYLDHQDVCAMGRLFTSGQLPVERVVSLAGPLVRHPRLVRTRQGACVPDLVRDELTEGSRRVLSGSVLSGRHASGWASHLGRHHSQVTVLPEHAPSETRRTHRFHFHRLPWPWRRRLLALGTAQHGPEEALVPLGSFERVMPLDLLPTPLVRALLVGDVEAAEALGCLELEEEDLALCSFLCPSKIDYGRALRRVLTEIERQW